MSEEYWEPVGVWAEDNKVCLDTMGTFEDRDDAEFVAMNIKTYLPKATHGFVVRVVRQRVQHSHLAMWEVGGKTSPSGKLIHTCRICKRESTTPDKVCRVIPGGAQG